VLCPRSSFGPRRSSGMGEGRVIVPHGRDAWRIGDPGGRDVPGRDAAVEMFPGAEMFRGEESNLHTRLQRPVSCR
jgi:hypothetical protein